MQETNRADEKKEKSVTWNGGALVAGLKVALLSRQPAVVADVASLSSLICFVVLSVSSVFRFPCQQYSCLSAGIRGGAAGASGAAGGGEEEDRPWYTEDAASASLYFLLLPPAFCWCFVSPFTLFSLFLS
jgi:hypothetical protein